MSTFQVISLVSMPAYRYVIPKKKPNYEGIGLLKMPPQFFCKSRNRNHEPGMNAIYTSVFQPFSNYGTLFTKTTTKLNMHRAGQRCFELLALIGSPQLL